MAFFHDEHGNPLPKGTAIEFPSYYHHEAIIDFDCYGQQVLLEKSKRMGKPTITDPATYLNIKAQVSRRPATVAHAFQITTRARAEIAAGKPWTIWDNCQDFVSRAYEGKSGSKGRNFVTGAAAVLGLAAILAG